MTRVRSNELQTAGRDFLLVEPELLTASPIARSTAQNGAVDVFVALCHYRLVPGETKNQFSLPREPLNACGRAKSNSLLVKRWGDPT